MLTIVPAAIDAYCTAHSSTPSPLLCELEAYTRAHSAHANMLTGPVEGALLKLLIQVAGARQVLEIGTFTGYSALTMAEALPEGGTVLTCDIDPEVTRIARSFWERSPHGGKITLKLGPALATIAALESSTSFDLVFIDADKEHYVDYLDACMPHVRPGGLLVADNALWSGKVLDPREDTDRAIVAFNQRVHQDPRLEHALLPVRDGIMLVRKR